MFKECINLLSIDLSNLNFSPLQSMEGMFWECSNLEIIDLSNLVLPSLINTTFMFYGCKSLSNLNIFDINFPSLLSAVMIFLGPPGRGPKKNKNFYPKWAGGPKKIKIVISIKYNKIIIKIY